MTDAEKQEHMSMIKIAFARLRAVDVIEFLGPEVPADDMVTTFAAGIAIFICQLPDDKRGEALESIARATRGMVTMIAGEMPAARVVST